MVWLLSHKILRASDGQLLDRKYLPDNARPNPLPNMLGELSGFGLCPLLGGRRLLTLA